LPKFTEEERKLIHGSSDVRNLACRMTLADNSFMITHSVLRHEREFMQMLSLNPDPSNPSSRLTPRTSLKLAVTILMV
jgi:hypothetical protein